MRHWLADVAPPPSSGLSSGTVTCVVAGVLILAVLGVVVAVSMRRKK